MNIQVLSLSKKRENDKTEYIPFSFMLERRLKKAAGKNPDLIIVENSFSGGEEGFKSRFAFIIRHAESKAQKLPKTRVKTDFKGIFKALKNREKPPFHQPETVTYERKGVHVFSINILEKKAYTFNLGSTRVLALPRGMKAYHREELYRRVCSVFEENSALYPDGYSISERTLRVTTFFERHIPLRRDSKSELVRKSVMLAAICVFVVAGYMFLDNILFAPLQNAAVQSEIQTIAYQQNGSKSSGSKKLQKLNWKGLKATNSEIRGWIHMKDTQINYPIVQNKNDNKDFQFYLHHNFKKEPSSYGAIFIDYRSKKGMKSKNVVIHGHSMDDASMFGDLLKFGRTSIDMGFYKKTPTFKISTPDGKTSTYKIISVFKSNVYTHQGEYFDFYCGSFKSKAQFMNYVYNLRIRSLVNCPVTTNERDQIVSLVTCSYEFEKFRTVVVARKCRKNESETVDVGAASPNGSAVWPQCYYSRYGGTRPTISTFKKALKNGKINWYDGNKKLLKGSEQLPTTVTVPTEPTTAPTTTTQPTTTTKATEKPTVDPKKQSYKIQVRVRGKYVINKKVKYNTKVKLPEIKSFKRGGFLYSLRKWKVKGFGKRKYLSRAVNTIIVCNDVKLAAVYKKTKIKTVSKPKPTKPAQAVTEAPTEADEGEEE